MTRVALAAGATLRAVRESLEVIVLSTADAGMLTSALTGRMLERILK